MENQIIRTPTDQKHTTHNVFADAVEAHEKNGTPLNVEVSKALGLPDDAMDKIMNAGGILTAPVDGGIINLLSTNALVLMMKSSNEDAFGACTEALIAFARTLSSMAFIIEADDNPSEETMNNMADALLTGACCRLGSEGKLVDIINSIEKLMEKHGTVAPHTEDEPDE